MSCLLILGAGGLGQMIEEMALSTGYDRVVFLDDASVRQNVIGKCCDYKLLRAEYNTAVAAFGDDELRLCWTNKLLAAGYTVPAMIHPSAFVSPSARIEDGCFVLPRAVVNTNVTVHRAGLVNSAAVVDHDAVVEDGAHIGVGAVIKAYCNIERCRKIRAGKVVSATHRKIDGVHNGNLEDAIYAFGFGPGCSYVKPFGSGHINETYAVYMTTEQGDELRYILQRINLDVFKDPAGVMENIFGVTEYLRTEIRKEGGNPDRETLCYIKTKTGMNFFQDNDGRPWRCYNYIPGSVCYQKVEQPEQFYQSARSFGHFLKQLQKYPAATLHETIPDFHNTEKYFGRLVKALRQDVMNRAASCRKEAAFVLARREDCRVLVQQQENGMLPLRVTHNDTKLNNILFDEKTGKGLCIIDLDTIMPGLAANDFGDSIRFGATTAAEDEPNIDLVHFDLDLYKLYVKGYLAETGDLLTGAELSSLPWGARLITLECGIRFLTDYLQGDTYFKTAYPEHNLVRARTQFRLVEEMEQQFEAMQAAVAR